MPLYKLSDPERRSNSILESTKKNHHDSAEQNRHLKADAVTLHTSRTVNTCPICNVYCRRSIPTQREDWLNIRDTEQKERERAGETERRRESLCRHTSHHRSQITTAPPLLLYLLVRRNMLPAGYLGVALSSRSSSGEPEADRKQQSLWDSVTAMQHEL